MKVHETNLDGVLRLEPSTFFEDFRGEYVETYNAESFLRSGIDIAFNEDDISVSTRHVLRGFHGDQKRTKLVTCLYGKFLLVIVNNDPESQQYQKHETFTLSDKNYNSVLIPPKFGNAHLVLSEKAIFHYKQTGTYDRDGQFTLAWNDPALKVWWPIDYPILSQRDALV
jgi:dTDP-4-dehydrorhamnose 3,5-epimerase